MTFTASRTCLRLLFVAGAIVALCYGGQGVSRSINYADRFHPNEDLMSKLIDLAVSNDLVAANISTCVGSVQYCGIRTANQSFLTNFTAGPYEIVSLVGTIAVDGQPHIHISLADKYGRMVGGHLPSLEERAQYNKTDFNCPIYTTAEVVLSENIDLLFKREIDPETTYDELYIYQRYLPEKQRQGDYQTQQK